MCDASPPSPQSPLVLVRSADPEIRQPPEHEFVQEIQADGSDYFLLTVVEDEGHRRYDLMLADGNECFRGKLNASNLKGSAPRELSHAALTTGAAEFVYSVTTDKSGGKFFCWKQRLAEGALRILGQAVLGPSTSVDMLSAAVRIVRDREARLAQVVAQLDRLRSDHESALEKLERSVRAKQDMERELYSKFALVLNAKKQRIAQLQGASPARSPPRVDRRERNHGDGDRGAGESNAEMMIDSLI